MTEKGKKVVVNSPASPRRRIHHKFKRSFTKTLFNLEKFENARSLRISADSWITIIIVFFKYNSRMTDDSFVLKSLLRSLENIWRVFGVETSFLWFSVNKA